ncbi:MAG: hypothetical protein QXW65_02805 [Candidatus Pacearchaeota archaeon]
MKKTNFFLVVLIFLILLATIGAAPGCGQKKIIFNTTALQVSFVQDAPPKEVNYGVAFPIYAEVKNLGGYDLAPGAASFYLSGIGENLIGVEKKLSNTGFLSKKTPIQQGGSEVLNFATAAQVARQLPSAFNLTIKLTSCYNYATITQTTICVGKKDCPGVALAGNKIITGSNTAAPIQVTELTEQVQGNKLYVFFKIQNKGAGEVYLQDADCDRIELQDVNEQLKKNKVNIAIRAEQGFTCNLQTAQAPYTSTKSLEGVAYVEYQVVCEKTLTEADLHAAPIEILLSYKYRESITKSLTILP